MASDMKLQQDVIAELAWEPRVDAAHIGVTAENGVVTLTGHVKSLAAKHAAEAAARRVKGVRALAEEIEIRLPTDRKWHDDEIAKRATDILAWRAPDLANRITVTVAGGIVTLEGTVDHYFDSDEAEADVRRLSGVRGIENRLAIRESVNADVIADQITAAFARSADLESNRITVTTEGGLVTLTGRVRSWYERELAERAAWAAPGATQIRNEILVEP